MNSLNETQEARKDSIANSVFFPAIVCTDPERILSRKRSLQLKHRHPREKSYRKMRRSMMTVKAPTQLDALLDQEAAAAALTLALEPVGEVDGHWREGERDCSERTSTWNA